MLTQARHHGYGEVGEHRLRRTASCSPGDLLAEPVLGLARDRDPLVAGLLAEPGDATPRGLRCLRTVRLTLEQALRRLTPRQRTVLVLRYFEDLTEVRTAAELGISSGAVKSMTRQALQRLRVLAPELSDLVGADA